MTGTRTTLLVAFPAAALGLSLMAGNPSPAFGHQPATEADE